MAKVIKDTKVFFNGINTLLIEGVEYSDTAAIVKAKPELFTGSTPAPKVKKAKKVEEIVIEEKFEAPKEELLIEEPVAELVVETVEETVETEEEKPKRRKRK